MLELNKYYDHTTNYSNDRRKESYVCFVVYQKITSKPYICNE